jgi:outer membrane receptor protein involved in Fe transport
LIAALLKTVNYIRSLTPLLVSDNPVDADTGGDKIFYNYSHVFSGFSGSLGATYNFTEKLSVKANVSRDIVRPILQKFHPMGCIPEQIYQIGNSSFKPEFSLQEDIDLLLIQNMRRSISVYLIIRSPITFSINAR